MHDDCGAAAAVRSCDACVRCRRLALADQQASQFLAHKACYMYLTLHTKNGPGHLLLAATANKLFNCSFFLTLFIHPPYDFPPSS